MAFATPSQAIADLAEPGGAALARQEYLLSDATIVQPVAGASVSAGGVITMPGGLGATSPTDANAFVLEWPLRTSAGEAAAVAAWREPFSGDLVLGMDPATVVPDDSDLEVVLYLQGNGSTGDGQAAHGVAYSFGAGASVDGARWVLSVGGSAWATSVATSMGLDKAADERRIIMTWGSTVYASNRGVRMRWEMTSYIMAAQGLHQSVSSNAGRSWQGHIANDIGTPAPMTLRLAVFRRLGAAGAIDVQPIVSGTYQEHIDVS